MYFRVFATNNFLLFFVNWLVNNVPRISFLYLKVYMYWHTDAFLLIIHKNNATRISAKSFM